MERQPATGGSSEQQNKNMEDKKPKALKNYDEEGFRQVIEEVREAENLILLAGREIEVNGVQSIALMPIMSGCCLSCLADYMARALSTNEELLQVTLMALEKVFEGQIADPKGEYNLKTGKTKDFPKKMPLSKGGRA